MKHMRLRVGGIRKKERKPAFRIPEFMEKRRLNPDVLMICRVLGERNPTKVLENRRKEKERKEAA